MDPWAQRLFTPARLPLEVFRGLTYRATIELFKDEECTEPFSTADLYELIFAIPGVLTLEREAGLEATGHAVSIEIDSVASAEAPRGQRGWVLTLTEPSTDPPVSGAGAHGTATFKDPAAR